MVLIAEAGWIGARVEDALNALHAEAPATFEHAGECEVDYPTTCSRKPLDKTTHWRTITWNAH
ncbi:MAG: hypothetical protein IPG10_05010 [Flavobacteriales bacterium]|nr:hypothetical protein [Flavobacteriales bacterium]